MGVWVVREQNDTGNWLACMVQSIQVNCIMRLISFFILFLSLRGSKGFSVDYVFNKLKSIQGLFGPLSQKEGW